MARRPDADHVLSREQLAYCKIQLARMQGSAKRPMTIPVGIVYPRSMASVESVLFFCAEKQRLMTTITAAASEYLNAHSEKLKGAAIGDDVGFDARIRVARQRTVDAKQALAKHLGEHGC